MAHDFYMTMAQLIPVIGIGYGIEVNTTAKALRNSAVSQWLAWTQVGIYVVVGVGLLLCWWVSLYALLAPDRWMDGTFRYWVLTITVLGGVTVITQPIFNFIWDVQARGKALRAKR